MTQRQQYPLLCCCLPAKLEAKYHASFKDHADAGIVHHPLACQRIARAIDGGVIHRAIRKPKFCGKWTQQPTCSLVEADLDVVQVAGGGKRKVRRYQRCCCVVADCRQRNESRLAQQEQVAAMSLCVQRMREQAVMLLCGQRTGRQNLRKWHCCLCTGSRRQMGEESRRQRCHCAGSG